MRVCVALLAVLWAMWLTTASVVGERVVRDAADYHSLQGSCTLPHQDSLQGTASWSWWPPGEVCRDSHGHVFRQPQEWRRPAVAATGAGFVILAAATVALARRDRDDEDDLDLSDLSRVGAWGA